ncbi:MAG: ABC transporter ATP-binding protein [Zavarzinella sp.]|nr:ABC transporter ATP-binding protein [Zavarzinella sp.]
MPDIRLTDLRKTFPNGTVGLHPTTLVIPDGSYFVLLGPSGSGKTTLLRLIAGLETPDGGTIHFRDRAVHSLPPHKRGVAFVPQRSALYPDRDVAGNIRAGLEFEQASRPRSERLPPSETDSRLRQAAESLGIAGLLGNRPHELSSGEQRRVMLARALVRRADVWLLDEPLGQLDSALAEKLSQDLHLLQKHFRLTIIQVTHDPIEALALADRVGLLGGGRILQSGTPDEVYTRPGSRTVGLHFGRPPINLLDGSADGTGFTNGWVRVPYPHRGAVTLGVRPEDVAFSAENGFIQVGEGEVTANRRVDGRHLITVAGPHGEIRGFMDRPLEGRVGIWLRADRVHWFDQQTGNRIDS